MQELNFEMVSVEMKARAEKDFVLFSPQPSMKNMKVEFFLKKPRKKIVYPFFCVTGRFIQPVTLIVMFLYIILGT